MRSRYLFCFCLLASASLISLAIKSHAQSDPLYPINWINKIGVTTSGTILTKTLPLHTWTNAGAISSNILPPNTDGWIQFTTTSGSDFFIGLAVNNIMNYTEYTNGIRIHNSGNAMYAYEGQTGTNMGVWQAGDVFKIARVDNAVLYYKNGTLLRTVIVNPAQPLKVKVSIQVQGASSPSITTTFDSKLVVQGTVTGTEGDGGLGAVAVNVIGGTPPYSYSWSGGELTSSIANKPKGSYTVTVTDAAGRLINQTYNIGYKIGWINVVGAGVSDNILTKNTGLQTWTNSGAISSNILPSNEDGWMQFSLSSTSDYIIGLSINNIIDYDGFKYGIRIQNTSNMIISHEDGAVIGLGFWEIGDVLKISREGDSIVYYRNHDILRKLAVSPAYPLKIKVSIQHSGKASPNITTSFDRKLILQGTVTGSDGNSGSGSIAVSVIGGTTPYTYNWSTGEQTSSVHNKARGSYTLTVTDAVGRTQERTYNLGYKINWTNIIGVTTAGDILTKNLGIQTWTSSGAISSNILPANTNGWIEFSATSSADYIIGLSLNNILDYTGFSYGIQINNASNISLGREGLGNNDFGFWEIGDLFRISRQDDTVYYYRNETLLRRVKINPALPLKVKVSIQHPGKSSPNITTSFDSKLMVQGTVTGLEGNKGSGSLSVNVSGGTPPYSCHWSSGEETSVISGKARGEYVLTVTDGVGRVLTRRYAIGYKVDWVNKKGVTSNGDILTKNLGVLTWTNSGANSSNILPANTNGWTEFSTTSAADYIIGLSIDNIIDYAGFNYGIQFNNASNLSYAREGNANSILDYFETGDVFRIERDGVNVRYYRNGDILKTLTVNPALQLKLKVSIQHPGKSTPNLTTSFWSSDGIVRTYYSIANGNWTTPSTWSLTENGPPSTVYPDDIDKAVIKGYEITVDSHIKSSGIAITSINDNTRLKVEGGMGVLTIKGNVVVNRGNGSQTSQVMLVQNGGKLDVK